MIDGHLLAHALDQVAATQHCVRSHGQAGYWPL